MKIKISIFAFLAIVLLSACGRRDEPEKIKYGVDVCDFCKMTIVDPKWGAELMTKKGKIYKFDVVECMIAYAASFMKEDEIKHYWTTNFLAPGTFLDAKKAIYIRTLQFPSPMGLNSLAIEKISDTSKLHLMPGYEVLNWDKVVEKAKEELIR